jgi:hypothetical protein
LPLLERGVIKMLSVFILYRSVSGIVLSFLILFNRTSSLHAEARRSRSLSFSARSAIYTLLNERDCSTRTIRSDCTPCRLSDRSQNFIKEELYFGMGEAEGKNVTETQWQLFLQQEITTRFPQGLTVVNAYGQYFNSHKQLIRENTKLVILIHQNNSHENQLIEEIIAIYKKKFQQESVLRVTSIIQISF